MMIRPVCISDLSRYSLALLLFFTLFSKLAQAQVSAELCGPMSLPMQYGPYDYRTDKDKLTIVEVAHFTAQVEALLRGQSAASYATDISYTLQRFPNHHRALLSVMRMVERKILAVRELLHPPECYFERALRWRKDDVVARMLYAKFLADQNRKHEAIHQLEITERFAADNPLTHRNLGRLLIEMKEYPSALAQAYKLLKLDPADTSLRESLTLVGQWREPDVPTQPDPRLTDAAPEPAPAASTR